MKPDVSRRFPTPARLSGPQSVALEALLSGATLTSAAERSSVARQTVSEWCNHDPAFNAALRTARAELRAEQAGRLAALGARALGTLDGLLDAEDPRVKLEAVKLVLSIAAPPEADHGCRCTAEEIAEEYEEGRRKGARWEAMKAAGATDSELIAAALDGDL